jgi:NAD(P)-dependent dehydrogenase (short-subunit alcohol dehydrogenase family)
MKDFTGQVVVVTGGANGIGKATSELFVELGAQVVVFDREQPENKAGIDNLMIDLGNLGDLEIAIADVVKKYGRIDVLVNVAGVSIPNTILDLEVDKYFTTLDINLHAPIFLIKHVGKIMIKQSYGRIVNLTSIHGKLSEPTSTAYDISKAGLEAATRTAALEFAEFGVLVNAVAPGFVSTRMSIVNGEDKLDSDWFKEVYIKNKRLPIARPALPVEIAHVITWLASSSNTYVTGQTLTVDGGLSARF